MGRPSLNPSVFARLEMRSQRLRADYGLTVEQVALLSARAVEILGDRIHPTVFPYDPSIDPENWCEGIGPVLDATILQAYLDASYDFEIHVSYIERGAGYKIQWTRPCPSRSPKNLNSKESHPPDQRTDLPR
jgi:hypothetical protein